MGIFLTPTCHSGWSGAEYRPSSVQSSSWKVLKYEYRITKLETNPNLKCSRYSHKTAQNNTKYVIKVTLNWWDRPGIPFPGHNSLGPLPHFNKGAVKPTDDAPRVGYPRRSNAYPCDAGVGIHKYPLPWIPDSWSQEWHLHPVHIAKSLLPAVINRHSLTS